MSKGFNVDFEYQGYVFLGGAQGTFEARDGRRVPFFNMFVLSVLKKAETENGQTSYLYNGYRFFLEAEVDAVQTHNAEDAIKSAWGVDVSIGEDKSLHL